MLNKIVKLVSITFITCLFVASSVYANSVGEISGGTELTPAAVSDSPNVDQDSTRTLSGDLSNLSDYITGGDDLTDIFKNLYTSLNKIYPVLIGLCYILGVFFIAKALFMLKKHGYKTAFMNADQSILTPMVVMFVGVILMYTPGFLKIMFYTLYGEDVQPTGSWQQEAGGSSAWYSALVPMVGLVQVLGLIAFIRGWILVIKGAAPGSQPGNVSKGLMHVLGGILAINITGTIDIINKSLGITGIS